MAEAKIGVIGGSGLYEMSGLADLHEVKPDTPYGLPSDVITIGRIEGIAAAFLPRHGRGHRLLPGEVPAAANIYALKTLGVEQIISVSAVGSLKEEVHPLDILVPDQLIDRTRQRRSTFFGDGLVAHIGFADPFCPTLSDILAEEAIDAGAAVHKGGAYVVIEGPAFSTRSESFLYRSWGASVIGMTALPEAKLAREAEMCYATLALVTDFDTWHETEASVSVELVIGNLTRNVDRAREIIRKVVPRLSGERNCACATALKDALVTTGESIPEATRQRLAPLIGKYIASAIVA